MKILHISNDFSKTKVHTFLYRELDKLGVEQTVFNPIRDANLEGRNAFEAKHTEFIYANVVKPYHKYVYHIKRKHVFREMLKRIDAKQYNLCHATTLLTDGGLAYLLFKKYQIPYIVAVRNTDINGFLDLMPHTWLAARKILLNAEKIIFISEGLKQKFINHISVRSIIPKIENKFVLLPNGIHDYYLDHIQYEARKGHGIIYIGNFSKNKNVVRLANAVLELRKQLQFQDCTLTLVGGGKVERGEIEQIISDHPDVFHFLGPIYEQEKLCKVLAQNRVFAMPSIHETFGLVYIEALSQNLPVLYTKGQGVDGLLPITAGVGVNPFSVSDIAKALQKLITDKQGFFSNSGIDFTLFRWSLIAEKYAGLYRGILY